MEAIVEDVDKGKSKRCARIGNAKIFEYFHAIGKNNGSIGNIWKYEYVLEYLSRVIKEIC
jgi:hypothetical protein